MSNRASYVYSSHKSLNNAVAALEEDYALGIVFPCEVEGIRKVGNRWRIYLWAE